jgi:hypothetical protein
MQASVRGLEPRGSHVLAPSQRADGGGSLGPLAVFITNPAGTAIVNALGPIRQIVPSDVPRRDLVIVPGAGATQLGAPGQIQER